MNTNTSSNKIGLLSGSTLKLIAALCMLIDHVGHHLFPSVTILRIIGRIAFPIFAFFIAEGCRYTRNKLRYFTLIFLSGLTFFVGTYLFSKIVFYNVFLNFSISILCVYVLQAIKMFLFSGKRRKRDVVILAFAYFVILVGAYFVFEGISIEYGFFGMMIPVLLNLVDLRTFVRSERVGVIDNIYVRVALVGAMLVLIHVTGKSSVQIYSLLALPLLLLYNGKRGVAKLKYFFYIFYPAHVAVIYAIKACIEHFAK